MHPVAKLPLQGPLDHSRGGITSHDLSAGPDLPGKHLCQSPGSAAGFEDGLTGADIPKPEELTEDMLFRS
jgi:hypothetical protein